MKYGYFDHENRTYVITTPKTPTKWTNYIGTSQFGGFVDQTGGGVICKGDPAFNRIVKYIPQLPLCDFNGETLYVRTRKNHKQKVFSALYTPTLDPYDRYECHVGLGYNRYITQFHGLQFDILILSHWGKPASSGRSRFPMSQMRPSK